MIDTNIDTNCYNNNTSWLSNDIYNTIENYIRKQACSSISLKYNAEPPKKSYKQFTLEFPEIDKVIFHAPATVIIFKDGTKSVVKCSEHDEYDPEKGFAMALLKHILGKKKYKTVFKKYVK